MVKNQPTPGGIIKERMDNLMIIKSCELADSVIFQIKLMEILISISGRDKGDGTVKWNKHRGKCPGSLCQSGFFFCFKSIFKKIQILRSGFIRIFRFFGKINYFAIRMPGRSTFHSTGNFLFLFCFNRVYK